MLCLVRVHIALPPKGLSILRARTLGVTTETWNQNRFVGPTFLFSSESSPLEILVAVSKRPVEEMLAIHSLQAVFDDINKRHHFEGTEALRLFLTRIHSSAPTAKR